MLDVLALKSEFEGAITDAKVPGLAIVRGERVTYAHGFGVTCVEAHGRPVTPDMLFRIRPRAEVLAGMGGQACGPAGTALVARGAGTVIVAPGVWAYASASGSACQ